MKPTEDHGLVDLSIWISIRKPIRHHGAPTVSHMHQQGLECKLETSVVEFAFFLFRLEAWVSCVEEQALAVRTVASHGHPRQIIEPSIVHRTNYSCLSPIGQVTCNLSPFSTREGIERRIRFLSCELQRTRRAAT